MVLNEQTVKNSPHGIIWDDTLKGFGLRTGKKTKTWLVLVASGRRKRIGRFPTLSIADARKTARKILAEKTLGTIVPRHEAYEDARDAFLEDCAHLRPLTVKLYKRHLTRNLPFGRRSVGDVTATEILRVLRPLSRSEKEHAFRIGRTFFTWCHRQHLIERSPMERLEPPPLGKARDRVLSDEELTKVYKHSLDLATPLHRLVWLLIRTGQRQGELRHLKWAYIGLYHITLPSDITKNGREHKFPISEHTYKLLSTFPSIDDSPYVFPAYRSHVRGKPTKVFSATSEARKDFQEACGVQGWTLHDLRRTVATNLQQLGVRLEVTEALLNHVSGSRSGIVGVYQRHTYFNEMSDAIASWDFKLATLVAPRA